MIDLKDAVEKCEEIGKIFKHFTKTEWIFDNSNAQLMIKYMNENNQ
jgi:hypothetical protein